MHAPIITGTLHSLSSTGTYFNQVLSLSSTPISSFSVGGWSSLVSLIMSLLTNPFFYGVILLILLLSILPTFED